MLHESAQKAKAKPCCSDQYKGVQSKFLAKALAAVGEKSGETKSPVAFGRAVTNGRTPEWELKRTTEPWCIEMVDHALKLICTTVSQRIFFEHRNGNCFKPFFPELLDKLHVAF